MHYKNLAFAALAGIVLLSSCVKDLETKSVTDIRNAKLEEIKSLTALNNAEAAAKKTLADAEALLMAAQADAQKANAEYIRAQAEYQQAMTEGLLITNQQRAAELEAALIRAEIAKEKAQAELDNLAMQLEKDFLEAQKGLLEARAKYNSDIADAYASATSDLLTAQKELAGLKIDLTKAEEKLVDLQTSQEKLIADNNAQIATYEKIVAAYREHMGMTEEELAAKRVELNSLLLEKSVPYASAWDIYYDAQAKLSGFVYYDEAGNARNVNGARDDFDQTYYLIKNPNFSLYANAGSYWFPVYFLKESVEPNWKGFRTYSFKYYDVDGNEVDTPVVKVPEYVYDIEWDESSQAIVYRYRDYKEQTLFESTKDGKISSLPYRNALRTYGKAEILDPDAPATVAAVAKEVIAKEHESDVAELQTKINKNTALAAAYKKAVDAYEAKTKDFYTEKEGLEKKYDEAVVAYGKALKPYYEYLSVHNTELYAADRALVKAEEVQDGITGKIDETKGKIEDTKDDIIDHEEDVAIATGDVKDCQVEVETATNDVKDAQTAYDTQLAIVKPLLEALNTAVAAERKAYLEFLAGTGTYEAYAAAMQATTEARNAWSGPNSILERREGELNTAKTTLTTAQGNLKDAEDAKVEAEGLLDSSKKELASLESDLAKLESNLTDAEKAVKAAEEAVKAAEATMDETSEEYVALKEAKEAASAECDKLEDSIDAVQDKIYEIEGHGEDGMKLQVAYSYDDLVNGCLVNDNFEVARYSKALRRLSKREANVEKFTDELADDETSFDDFNKQVDEWLEEITAIVESEASYSADVDALNELENTTFELYKEYILAEDAYSEVYAEIKALDRIVGENIDYYLDKIKELKDKNANIAAITTQEQLIAGYKVDIANKEQEIKVLEKKVEEYKAALDAALAEEENTTEE